MNDDRRTEKKPRVRPSAVDPNIAARRARLAAEGAPVKRRPEDSAYARPKKSPPKEASARRAERLYPDDAYYQKSRPQGDPRRRPSHNKKKGRRKKRGSIGGALVWSAVAIVAALVVSTLMHTFLFQVMRVSGDAMYEALLPGDWVVITKYDYWTQSPARGDIVAVAVDGGVILRRVVGLPAETVAIDGNGDTLIMGNPLGEDYVTLKNYDQYPEVELKGGRYFVLSDNRTVKLDSRDPSIDMVAKQRIIGKVKTILYPFSRSGTLQ